MPLMLGAAGQGQAPSLISAVPFALLLLAIAVLPLFQGTHHWWERNRNKLLISVGLGLATLGYYYLRPTGFDHAQPGMETVQAVVQHALVDDYLPFIMVLFSLYTISGGIRWEIGRRPTPLVNGLLLLVGTLLASFIGTTGAAMLLIRPLLEVNAARKYKTHTVVFFIFLVANIGGSLLPLGDPPLFLGYLRGVPFLWTLNLFTPWLWCSAFLLGLYVLCDVVLYRREGELLQPEGKPFRAEGRINYLWLAGVVLCVALVIPGKPLPGTAWLVPPHLREGLLLLLTVLSWATTPTGLRKRNEFHFGPIAEVASLFIGIFICMMPPLEILRIHGPELGLRHPWHFFWATGLLSSVLDNAPTYVVFFETAASLNPGAALPADVLLLPISVGAVFMGAITYIGNGPNFMVKSIAEARGVRMPGFFGYCLYSGFILLPLFIVLTLIFFA